MATRAPIGAKKTWKPAQTNLVLPGLGLKAKRRERVRSRKCHIQHSGPGVWLPIPITFPTQHSSFPAWNIPLSLKLSRLIELISEMWLRFPRFLPAVPSSDIFVVYPLRARNPPWQLDSHTQEEKFVSGKLLPVGICKCAAVEIQKGQLDKSELARVEFIGWDNNVEPLQEL